MPEFCLGFLGMFLDAREHFLSARKVFLGERESFQDVREYILEAGKEAVLVKRLPKMDTYCN